MNIITRSILKNLYRPPKNSRKGKNGILLIIGGSKKYHGAPWYAIEIASKIVDLMQEIKTKSPAFITVGKKELAETIKKSDAVLIGPGWGVTRKNKKLINSLLKKNIGKRFVLDADALKMVDKKLLNINCLVTPHAGEFKLLFGVKASPENTAMMARKFHCHILLKGVKDIICSPKECFFNIMTKGGTGDVLAGLVVALACKNDLFLAGKAGALINGLAGDMLYKKVGVYYNAGDLIGEMPKVLKL
jgi:hydroxyethylthiazole kinase-like uncharacterized protein yjeF